MTPRPMDPDLRSRRLLLSTTALELLRRQALPAPLGLPPGFELTGDATQSLDGAVAELLTTGAAQGDSDTWTPHPAVVADLRVLALPDVAVTVRAARPGLDVTACLALSGPRGAGLLRTGDTAVQLSAFAARHLAAELARVVPAPLADSPRAGQEVPLEHLLAGDGPLRGRPPGTLHATVVAGPGRGREPGAVGSVEWVWDGAGWVGLEPLPTRAGRPWVRLAPVTPVDLAPWLSALLARAAA